MIVRGRAVPPLERRRPPAWGRPGWGPQGAPTSNSSSATPVLGKIAMIRPRCRLGPGDSAHGKRSGKLYLFEESPTFSGPDRQDSGPGTKEAEAEPISMLDERNAARLRSSAKSGGAS